MSNKQKIRWSKSNSDESISYGLFGGVSGWSGMLLDVVCAFLYVYAARMMWCDVFGFEGPDSMDIFWLILAGLFVSITMEIAKGFNRQIRYGIYAGVFVAGLFLCWFSASVMEEWEYIVEGLKKLGSVYVGYWNAYFGTSYTIATMDIAGSSEILKELSIEYANIALDFICFVVLYFSMWVAKLRRNNLVTIVAPLIVFVGELLVGYSPKITGLFIVFAAVLMSNAHAWGSTVFKRVRSTKSGISVGSSDDDDMIPSNAGKVVSSFTWIMVAVGVVVICLSTYLFGSKSASEVVAGANDFKTSVNDFLDDIKNGNIFEALGVMAEPPKKSELTNKSPEYDDVPVMRLTTSARLYGNTYLKGFQANTYEDGVWTEDLTNYSSIATQLLKDQKKFANELASMGALKLCIYYSEDNLLATGMAANMNIYYYEKTDGRAYIPYFAEVNDANITIQGEGLYVKERRINELNLSIWQFGGLYEERLSFFEPVGQYDWEDEYHKHVSSAYNIYMDIPDEIQEAVKAVSSEISSADYADRIIDDVDTVNEERINDAFKVAQWMQENTKYTLTPPELPEGTDPIEFFLTDSKQGYCMHYASASVMIMRSMGIPARYVTGYVVSDDLFIKQQNSSSDLMLTLNSSEYLDSLSSSYAEVVAVETYEATVMDSMAHAWVEIYLDGIGWVPIEVTKGYNASAVTQEEMNNLLNPPEEPSTDEEPTSEEESTSEDESTSEEESTSEDESTSENESTTDKDEVGKGSGSIKALLNTLKVLIPVVLIVSIIGYVAYNIHKNQVAYMAKLQSDIRNRRTRAVIRKVNRDLYKKLRRSGRILKASVTDEEYCKILKKAYPEVENIDWNRYMNIVKAATFSTAEFTVEEMEFCLKIGEMIKCRRKGKEA